MANPVGLPGPTHRRGDAGDLVSVLVVVQVAGEVERGPPVQLVPDADVDPAVDQVLHLLNQSGHSKSSVR